jgi:GT2 family glycosyltransferase
MEENKISKVTDPKVLIGTPTFEGMEYCLKEFLDGVRGIDYSNYDVLFVDNSEEDTFFTELKKEEGIISVRDTTNDTSNVMRLISSRNIILQYALENNYDYVLMIDADVVPPKNVLKELLGCKKDIVSGWYFNYFNISGKTKWLPCVWKKLSHELFDEIKEKYPSLMDGYGSPESMTEHLTKPDVESGKLFEVVIPSAGCMLLSKAVFEKISYGMPEDKKPEQSDDIYFLEKARNAGFQPYCYTKVRCEHLVSGKYEKNSDGTLSHPLFRTGINNNNQ